MSFEVVLLSFFLSIVFSRTISIRIINRE
jgi:hypothetical protein